MRDVFYIKTPAGIEVVSQRARDLTPRQRQLMLLCSAQRPLTVLIELFGESVVRELHELVVSGYLQAVRLADTPGNPALDIGAGLGPEGVRAQTAARLQLARDFASVVARSLGTPEGDALAADHRDTTEPDDVLAYAAALVGLLFRSGDVARAGRVGYKLADLLPRDLVPMFVDCMLDGQDPQFAAALYEHLLSDRELPAPTERAA